jgi:hypothetical protein
MNELMTTLERIIETCAERPEKFVVHSPQNKIPVEIVELVVARWCRQWNRNFFQQHVRHYTTNFNYETLFVIFVIAVTQPFREANDYKIIVQSYIPETNVTRWHFAVVQ